MSVFCPFKEIQQDHPHRRRNTLTIASLLNDVSVEPLNDESSKDILPWKEDEPIYSYQIEYASPSCSSSSTSTNESESGKFLLSPLSSRSASPIDLWSHHHHQKMGNTYQTNNGDIIISSSLAKAKRKRILPFQYKRLIKTFEETDTPSSEIRAQLANELDMTNREVQVWFQNRRAKMNRSKVSQRSSRHSISAVYPSISPSSRPRRASSYIATTVNTYHQSTSAIELLASAAEMMRPEI